MKNKIIPFLAITISSMCFGAIFVAIFINAREINCTRQPNSSYTCDMRTLFFGKYQISDTKVENIVDITVEHDICDGSCGYRAEFVTASGQQVPLSSVWTDLPPVQRQVSAIKSQMATGGDITYRAEPPWWVLFLVGGLTLMVIVIAPFMLGGNKKR